MTPLYAAAEQGHDAVVGRLLAAGAAMNRMIRSGYEPLTIAVLNGHEAVVGRMLAAGAVVDEGATTENIFFGAPARSPRGQALLLAEKEGHATITAMLCDSPAVPLAGPAAEAAPVSADDAAAATPPAAPPVAGRPPAAL